MRQKKKKQSGPQIKRRRFRDGPHVSEAGMLWRVSQRVYQQKCPTPKYGTNLYWISYVGSVLSGNDKLTSPILQLTHPGSPKITVIH